MTELPKLQIRSDVLVIEGFGNCNLEFVIWDFKICILIFEICMSKYGGHAPSFRYFFLSNHQVGNSSQTKPCGTQSFLLTAASFRT